MSGVEASSGVGSGAAEDADCLLEDEQAIDEQFLMCELELMNVKQLQECCRENSISYRGRQSKVSLIAKLFGFFTTQHELGGHDDADVEDAVLFEEADIDAEIALISKGHICSGTRESYRKSQQQLFDYIQQNHADVALVVDSGNKAVGIQDLEHFDVEIFKKFIYRQGRKKLKDGKIVMNPLTKRPMLNAFETLSGFRKGLFNLFVESRIAMPAQFSADIKHFFIGLKRRDAREKAQGLRKNTEGKLPIPFSVYVKLIEKFIEEGKFFEASYASLTWNLICRTDNTAGITLKHMGSDADAITIMFNVSKTNQEGDEFEQKRRLYGNGRDHRLCVAFALGCYFMSYPELGTDDNLQLFPGTPGSQKKRFSESLIETLKSEDMVEYLAANGLKPSDIGAHSFRKGGATYLTSGSTGGPSIVAVCARAGWALGNVLDRYLKFDASGDAFVGRILAGYPLNLASFADLPPHVTNVAVSELATFFPLILKHPEMAGVCNFCLGSLLQFWPFVRDMANSRGRSLMMKFPLYSREQNSNTSRSVVCGPETPTSMFKATGVPPNVHILQQCLRAYHAIESLPQRVRALCFVLLFGCCCIVCVQLRCF